MFDLDGTLIDSKVAILKSAKRILHSLDVYSISDDQIVESIGLPIKTLFETKLSGKKLSVAVSNFQKDLLATGAGSTRIYPEVQNTLTELIKSGVKTAVVTNKPTKLAEVILLNLKLDNYFQFIIGIGGGLPPKPNGQMLVEAMNFFGAPRETYMIGDRMEDIQAAKCAGVKSILIMHKDHIESVSKGSNPDYTLTSFKQLPNLILRT
jgi:phosphoglycolate phosphatase-like HAD superfamily hydrolase